MLSSAEEDLLAGKISSGPAKPNEAPVPLLPPPVQQAQPTQTNTSAFWTMEYWKQYFNVDSKDVLN